MFIVHQVEHAVIVRSCGYEAAKAPTIECYGPEFNAMTGMGGFQIWVPIQT